MTRSSPTRGRCCATSSASSTPPSSSRARATSTTTWSTDGGPLDPQARHRGLASVGPAAAPPERPRPAGRARRGAGGVSCVPARSRLGDRAAAREAAGLGGRARRDPGAGRRAPPARAAEASARRPGEAGGSVLLRGAGASCACRSGEDRAGRAAADRRPGAEGMRVVGGDLRGRTLRAVPGRSTRPTADRVRQSLFDVLGQRCHRPHVLDRYAGTGALPPEALSRGAAHATLIEQDAKAAQIILRNARELGCEDRCTLVRDEVARALPRLAGPFDLVFSDPPYALRAAQETLDA